MTQVTALQLLCNLSRYLHPTYLLVTPTSRRKYQIILFKLLLNQILKNKIKKKEKGNRGIPEILKWEQREMYMLTPSLRKSAFDAH